MVKWFWFSGHVSSPTIRIQGQGQTSVAPDIVVLSITVSSKDKDYGKAVAALNRGSSTLRESLVEAGEDQQSLKTDSFSITTESEFLDGRRVFSGFVGNHKLTLRLPLDQLRIAKVFGAIFRSGAAPEVSLSFSVSDPEAVKRRVLESAVKNARQRAETIATAAGQKLGRIVNIEYGEREICIASNQFALGSAVCEEVPDFTPSDIESTDTVQITWELVGEDA